MIGYEVLDEVTSGGAACELLEVLELCGFLGSKAESEGASFLFSSHGRPPSCMGCAAGEFDLFDVDTSDLFGVCYGPLGVFAAWVKKDSFVHNLSVLNGLYCFLVCSGGLPQLLEAADDE